MVYIPNEWFKNQDNINTVFDLFENEHDPDKVKNRLEELGEETILKKYINCEISTQL